ncbi:hypothetical protein B0T18DRAFT_160004 [Schizothecium vesticola]|uniref:Cora-domain-containing protein n=1 Tax=Schizothecium vesticola TaxID=314040 RepID=A0AA40EWE7_9PEZI|nr:hypothetical protein B0T18DRAFT_160004 [Schizothecium vesticola]
MPRWAHTKRPRRGSQEAGTFTDPSVAPGHSGGEPADINRRVIGVPGLAAPEMEVLAAHATKSQKDALLKFYRHHINPSPSIECDMPSSGFRTLSLQFHVPYMVLRQHRKPRKDPRRRKPNGDSLRGSWPVGCIPATKPRARWYLHQAQRSLAVVVIAKRVWTAFGTTDIFFDGSKCKDSVAYRHDLWAKDELRDRVAMDPMGSWRVYVLGTDGVRKEGSDGDLLSDPWLYFLAMLEWAMTVAQCEYAPIITEMQEAVNNGYLVDATEQAQDLEGKWNADALEHIRRIMTCLGDLLDAWKTFQSEDPRFLNVDINARYLPSIKRLFSTLEKYHKQLAELKKKLKRNEAKIKQQLHVQVRDAQSYAQTLAILIIVFSPLSQVMSLFNMQGLPFTLTPASFALSLVGIGCMWVVVYWIVMRGITVTRFWRVYMRRCLGHATATACGQGTAGTCGHATARIWERVLSLVPRGKLGEVVEDEGPPASGGSTVLGGSTELGWSAAALWDSLQATTANTLPRPATWPMFLPWRRNERREDPGLTV